MGLVKGSDVLIQMNNGTELVPIGCARSITFDIQRDFIDTSITGQGIWQTSIPAAGSFSATIEGLVFLAADDDEKIQMNFFYQNIISGATVAVSFIDDDMSGNQLVKSFSGYIETITETASFDNIVSFSATIKGTGAPSISYA